MKCPKCGYNSFEFLDNCKKCGVEVVSFKNNMGILPVVFPSNETSLAGVTQIAANGLSGVSTAPVSEDATDESFSWEAPAAGDTMPGDKPFDGFDLDFIKPDEIATPDFSFNDETPTVHPAEKLEESPIDFEGFSFDETVEPVSVPDGNQLFAGNEEQLLGAEDMELSSVTDTGSFGESGVHGEFLPENLIDDNQETTTGGKTEQHSPPPEQSGQVFDLDDFINENEDKPDKKEPQVKKYSTDTLDFDKEFEAIFNEETSDSEKQPE